MATDLTAIFGNEINVTAQPRSSQRQYAGFAGGHGMVALHLGTRGYVLNLAAKLRATGVSYIAARATLEAAIRVIESYQWAAMADYTYKGTTHYNVVFDKMTIDVDGDGKGFNFTAGGWVTARVKAILVALL